MSNRLFFTGPKVVFFFDTFGRMGLQERFVSYLRNQALCRPGDRILLAVSGGKDSVLMARLFAESGFSIGIAHCNFGLRGNESDADEAFVADLAKSLDVPFYSTFFDTSAYARKHGVSIQMAARTLRYDWFETIRAGQGYDYIAVAHHQNDHIETLILNLVRGTGLSGLRGIQPRRGRIIRPLLFLRGEEIAAYVHKHRIAYRDDASNFSTKYARNKIRLEVIPRLKELNPELERTMVENINHFTDSYTVLQGYIDELRSRLFTKSGHEEWHIPIAALERLEPRGYLLFELLRPYGFTEAVTADMARTLSGTPGREFLSPTHRLYIDRDSAVLKRMETAERQVAFIVAPGDTVQWEEYRLVSGLTTETAVRPDANNAQFDADKIVFPICIRAWQDGDTFHPLGMKGRKKLSDFLISLKVPAYRKHTVPIVVNGNGDILWVVPYRLDDRYKITGETKKVFTLACF